MEKPDYLILDRAYYLKAIDRCEEQADKCEEAAASARDPRVRAHYLELAVTWMTFAENRRMQAGKMAP